jgi:thiol-disulfide isomerase/thioredoxin
MQNKGFRMIKKTLLIAAIALAVLLQGCNDSKNNTSQENSMVASNQFTLKDLSGKTYTITNQGNNFLLNGSDTKGKLVIFDIFATWCPPCRAEASRLAQIQELYKDSVKVVGLSVQKDITAQKLLDFRKMYGANYTLLYSKRNQELTAQIASTLPNVPANFPIPLMVIYKNGSLVKYYIGATPEEMIDSDIQKLLGK